MLESVDLLRLFTARDGDVLVGYSTMVLNPMHAMYEGLGWAGQDALYLSPEYRHGYTVIRFLKYQDLYLSAVDRVSIIYRTAPHVTKLGDLLVRCMGYRLNDRGYIRDCREAA